MPDAMKLWNFLKPYEPHILSAASNYLPASKQDKIEWVAQQLHLTGKKVIVVDYPNQKWRHCTPGAILIDDNTKNCAEWTKAGGIAILHKSVDDTIRKLKALLNHVDTHHVHEAFEQLKAQTQEPVCENVIETFDELIDRT
jgi:5'(3')-deoxyribonucleotidase